MSASDVPAWVTHYIGKPFADRGRGPDAFDCWGLVMDVLEQHFGITGLPDFADRYETAADQAVSALVAAEQQEPRWQRVEVPQAGDVIVMKVTGRPWHVGVAVSADRMLHVDRRITASLEYLNSERWRGRIDGIYRYRYS